MTPSMCRLVSYTSLLRCSVVCHWAGIFLGKSTLWHRGCMSARCASKTGRRLCFSRSLTPANGWTNGMSVEAWYTKVKSTLLKKEKRESDRNWDETRVNRRVFIQWRVAVLCQNVFPGWHAFPFPTGAWDGSNPAFFLLDQLIKTLY